MLVISSEQVQDLVSPKVLVDCLESAFREGCVIPQRQVIDVPPEASGRLFVSMPAFDFHGGGVIKVVTYYPDNPSNGRPSIQASIVVFSTSGVPTAVVDGTMTTRLRTAAASALASRFLSRADCSVMTVLGTGALAPYMAAAHCQMRPIRRVLVWGRRRQRAEDTALTIRRLVGGSIAVEAIDSAEQAVAISDIVSCSTSSAEPVLAGKWLRPGTFVDLVGSFSPAKREADDDVLIRARIYVDTFEGALAEAGDILNPMARGVINRDRVEGDLAELIRGSIGGRRSDEEITLFKSVGCALEDMAAAQLIVSLAQRRSIATKTQH